MPAAGAEPAYCQVTGSVTTRGDGAPDGSAGFILKLPANWNGRYVFLGCGGLCGVLTNTTGDTQALSAGYAVANTDTGHTAGPGSIFDATWALTASGAPNDPAIADYFYRAVHQVTLATKTYVQSYYGRPIAEAYFDGCSTGGRQALMEGERYPDDFDGLVAGDPAMDQVGQRAGVIKAADLFLPPENWIAPAVLEKVDAAILDSCDAADGVKDGLIQNPAVCAFDPRKLVRAGMLTPPQAQTLALYFTELKDPRGRLVTPGAPVGDLAGVTFVGMIESPAPSKNPTSATPWAGSGAPPFVWLLGAPQIKFLIERNAAFDVNRDWPERGDSISSAAFDLLSRRMADASSAGAAKLAPYLRRDGKVIIYHGFTDLLASPYTTIQFYESLARGEHGYAQLQRHARLFMAPGMGHCTGGAGPSNFDALTPLDRWVRLGAAPDQIVAKEPSSGRTMPLCPFPAEATYLGAGDINDAASWRCQRSDRRLLQVGPNGAAAGLNSEAHAAGGTH
jgi:feruloyl esterase